MTRYRGCLRTPGEAGLKRQAQTPHVDFSLNPDVFCVGQFARERFLLRTDRTGRTVAGRRGRELGLDKWRSVVIVLDDQDCQSCMMFPAGCVSNFEVPRYEAVSTRGLLAACQVVSRGGCAGPAAKFSTYVLSAGSHLPSPAQQGLAGRRSMSGLDRCVPSGADECKARTHDKPDGRFMLYRLL
ncbi:hypothetical protein PsYK624_054330 [Phanerochaete sordida]|uniref:Uncharacterized protein n=1 Tax=Phanerochaete sordida TaxID=48140 RepID=A0A9P3LC95_9APHY|nr:hypothetical protein PsYK624_054330 [Phanerochaete sordida]